MNSSVGFPQHLLLGLTKIDLAYVQELYQEYGLSCIRLLGANTSHYEYRELAGRLIIHQIKETTPGTVKEYVEVFKRMLSDECRDFMLDHTTELDEMLVHERDYSYSFFSASTMAKMYLARLCHKGAPMERPQFLHLRVAVQQHCHEGLEAVRRSYDQLSQLRFTHASPTQFNSCTKKANMISCFLLGPQDNLPSIMHRGAADPAMIMKHAGGIGMYIGNIRHSEIGETGWSGGTMAMLQVFNSTVRYVDQQGMRRGAWAVYLPPFHIDILDFIGIVKKNGDRYATVHDLHTALWIPDLFMERVRDNGMISIACPNKFRKIFNSNNEEFREAYAEMEATGQCSQVSARYIFKKANDMRLTAGEPYALYADACNRKSNQQHLGNINCSNLCTEIIEFNSADEVACCNLAGLNLKLLALHNQGLQALENASLSMEQWAVIFRDHVDFSALAYSTIVAIENLNQIIDKNYYPLDVRDEEGNILQEGPDRRSNLKHRPLGLGTSGWADLLYRLDMHFEHAGTSPLNKMLWACIYWNAMACSISLAVKYGSPYASFRGSPLSKGKFQFDLWEDEFQYLKMQGTCPNRLRKEGDATPLDPSMWGQESFALPNGDTIEPTWSDLRRCVMKYGALNSLLLAQMPTATSSQSLDNNEQTEAPITNSFMRSVEHGNFVVVNEHMQRDLEALDLWDSTTLQYIQANEGSLQGLDRYLEIDLPRLSYCIRKYKTMFELRQRIFMTLAAERGIYICQSQSLNLYLREVTDSKLNAWLMDTWLIGLKTGLYYLRQGGARAQSTTVDVEVLNAVDRLKRSPATLKNGCTEDCASCSV